KRSRFLQGTAVTKAPGAQPRQASGSKSFARTVIATRQTLPLATCTALAAKRSGPAWLAVRTTTWNDRCAATPWRTASSRLWKMGRFTPLALRRRMVTFHCGRGRWVVTLSLSTILLLTLTRPVSAICDRRSEHAALADAALRTTGSVAAAPAGAVETTVAAARGMIIPADQNFLFMTPPIIGAPAIRRVLRRCIPYART